MRIVAVAALVLLASSLAVVYALQSSPLLLALGGLVLLISLALAFLGGRREILLLGAFALLMSVAAAALIGELWWSLTGALVAPAVWMLLLYAGITLAWHSTIYVPSGTVLMITGPGGIRVCEGPSRILPPIPTFERHSVTMPLYELSSSFDVQQINTMSLQDVKRIEVEVHYRVRQPLKVLTGLPNRARIIEEMATALNLSPDLAVLKTGFWERLLERQIREETDNLLRTVIYERVQRAIDTSTERGTLAGEVRERLSELVQRWGIEIRSLEFKTVELDPNQIKSSKREAAIKREIEDAQRAAQIEAHKIEMMGKAQAEIQAHAISSWIRAIQEQNVHLSAEDIEQIVLNALEEMNERHRRIALFTSLSGSAPDTNERALAR